MMLHDNPNHRIGIMICAIPYILDTNRLIEQILKNCSRCFRKLTPVEIDLFNDDTNAVCRDCWVNQVFEPTVKAGQR